MKHLYESHSVGNGRSQVWKREFHLGGHTTDTLVRELDSQDAETLIWCMYTLEAAVEQLTLEELSTLTAFANGLKARSYFDNSKQR